MIQLLLLISNFIANHKINSLTKRIGKIESHLSEVPKVLSPKIKISKLSILLNDAQNDSNSFWNKYLTNERAKVLLSFLIVIVLLVLSYDNYHNHSLEKSIYYRYFHRILLSIIIFAVMIVFVMLFIKNIYFKSKSKNFKILYSEFRFLLKDSCTMINILTISLINSLTFYTIVECLIKSTNFIDKMVNIISFDPKSDCWQLINAIIIITTLSAIFWYILYFSYSLLNKGLLQTFNNKFTKYKPSFVLRYSTICLAFALTIIMIKNVNNKNFNFDSYNFFIILFILTVIEIFVANHIINRKLLNQVKLFPPDA